MRRSGIVSILLVLCSTINLTKAHSTACRNCRIDTPDNCRRGFKWNESQQRCYWQWKMIPGKTLEVATSLPGIISEAGHPLGGQVKPGLNYPCRNCRIDTPENCRRGFKWNESQQRCYWQWKIIPGQKQPKKGMGVVPQPKKDACASGWEQNGGRCFYFSRGETIKSYAAGETKCKSRHPSAHLASIHSKQEHDFILERVETKGHGTYIGGSDKELEGHWVWSDGSPWDYEYWSPKNPSNGAGKGEHCAMMWHDGLGRWNDAACDNIHQGGYVCSYDLRGRGATGYRSKKIPALIIH